MKKQDLKKIYKSALLVAGSCMLASCATPDRLWTQTPVFESLSMEEARTLCANENVVARTDAHYVHACVSFYIAYLNDPEKTPPAMRQALETDMGRLTQAQTGLENRSISYASYLDTSMKATCNVFTEVNYNQSYDRFYTGVDQKMYQLGEVIEGMADIVSNHAMGNTTVRYRSQDQRDIGHCMNLPAPGNAPGDAPGDARQHNQPEATRPPTALAYALGQ